MRSVGTILLRPTKWSIMMFFADMPFNFLHRESALLFAGRASLVQLTYKLFEHMILLRNCMMKKNRMNGATALDEIFSHCRTGSYIY